MASIVDSACEERLSVAASSPEVVTSDTDAEKDDDAIVAGVDKEAERELDEMEPDDTLRMDKSSVIKVMKSEVARLNAELEKERKQNEDNERRWLDSTEIIRDKIQIIKGLREEKCSLKNSLMQEKKDKLDAKREIEELRRSVMGIYSDFVTLIEGLYKHFGYCCGSPSRTEVRNVNMISVVAKDMFDKFEGCVTGELRVKMVNMKELIVKGTGLPGISSTIFAEGIEIITSSENQQSGASSEKESIDAPPENEQIETPPSSEQIETRPSIEQTETPPSREQIETRPSSEQIETTPSSEQIKTRPSSEQTETPPSSEQMETRPSSEQIETTPASEQTETTPSSEQIETTPASEQAETPPASEQTKTPSELQQMEMLSQTDQFMTPYKYDKSPTSSESSRFLTALDPEQFLTPGSMLETNKQLNYSKSPASDKNEQFMANELINEQEAEVSHDISNASIVENSDKENSSTGETAREHSTPFPYKATEVIQNGNSLNERPKHAENTSSFPGRKSSNFYCVCGWNSNENAAALERHIQDGYGGYQCYICGARFATYNALMRHMYTRHNGQTGWTAASGRFQTQLEGGGILSLESSLQESENTQPPKGSMARKPTADCAEPKGILKRGTGLQDSISAEGSDLSFTQNQKISPGTDSGHEVESPKTPLSMDLSQTSFQNLDTPQNGAESGTVQLNVDKAACIPGPLIVSPAENQELTMFFPTILSNNAKSCASAEPLRTLSLHPLHMNPVQNGSRSVSSKKIIRFSKESAQKPEKERGKAHRKSAANCTVTIGYLKRMEWKTAKVNLTEGNADMESEIANANAARKSGSNRSVSVNSAGEPNGKMKISQGKKEERVQSASASSKLQSQSKGVVVHANKHVLGARKVISTKKKKSDIQQGNGSHFNGTLRRSMRLSKASSTKRPEADNDTASSELPQTQSVWEDVTESPVLKEKLRLSMRHAKKLNSPQLGRIPIVVLPKETPDLETSKNVSTPSKVEHKKNVEMSTSKRHYCSCGSFFASNESLYRHTYYFTKKQQTK